MIVDASALVAIELREDGFEALIRKLLAADGAGIGTPTLVETAIVFGGRGSADPSAALSRLLDVFDITPVAFGEEHFREATRAWLVFGKSRHNASLNFGDCMTYAVAKLAREPLLCTGDDFAKTDLELA